MSSATATAAATTPPATTESPEMKTYWCHECDMSVSLSSPSNPSLSLSCPHCHTHFLELMDSPFQSSDSQTLPFDFQYDDVFQDPTFPAKSFSHSLPTITATSSLLSLLDPSGGVHCAVCKDPIGVDSQAKHLPCNHLYHSDCIVPWLEHHDSCPLCRFRLVGEKGEEEEEGRIRGQLRVAMMRLSEVMDAEEDFFGLRTTLGHIASRHRLLLSSSGVFSQPNDANANPSRDSVSAPVNADLESLSS